MGGPNESVDEGLEHHGVKGMHWGKHKTPEADHLSPNSRKLDTRQFGEGGAARINRRVGAGKTHKKAVHNEIVLNRVKTTALVGAIAGAAVIKRHGPKALIILKHVANSKLAAQGAKAAAAAFSNTHGIGANPTINLMFNATTGAWQL